MEFYEIVNEFKSLVEKLEINLLIDLFSLVTKVFMIAHISSCVFYYIGKLDEVNGWIAVFELGFEGYF